MIDTLYLVQNAHIIVASHGITGTASTVEKYYISAINQALQSLHHHLLHSRAMMQNNCDDDTFKT